MMYCTIHRNANSMTSLVSMLPGGGFGGGGPFGGAGGFSDGRYLLYVWRCVRRTWRRIWRLRRWRSSTPKYRGSDLRLKVRLSLQEVATGVTKKFKVRKDVPCEHCHGSGAEEGSGTETCQNCHGSGVEIRTQQSIFGMMQTQTTCHVCNGGELSLRTSVLTVMVKAL